MHVLDINVSDAVPCAAGSWNKAHGDDPGRQAAGIHSCDVAIVGGGLGGLVSAAAIRRTSPHLDVKVPSCAPLCVSRAKALSALFEEIHECAVTKLSLLFLMQMIILTEQSAAQAGA